MIWFRVNYFAGKNFLQISGKKLIKSTKKLHTCQHVLTANVSSDKPDVLSEKLLEARSSHRIASLIDFNKSSLTATHCSNALKVLATNFRNDTVTKGDLSIICNALTKKARFLTTSELINVISSLDWLSVSSRTIVAQTILQHLRTQINSLTFNQIFLLDGLLRKMSPTPLVTSLLKALPIVVNNQLDMQINDKHFHELVKLFRFAAYYNFGPNQIQKITTRILEHKSEWPVNDVLLILWGITSLKQQNQMKIQNLIDKTVEEFARNIDNISSSELLKLISYQQTTNNLTRTIFETAIQKARDENWDIENVHLLAKFAGETRIYNVSLLEMYLKSIEQNIYQKTLSIPIGEVINILSSLNYPISSTILEVIWNWTWLQLDKSQLHPKMLIELILNLTVLGMKPTILNKLIFSKFNIITYILENQELDISQIRKTLILLELMDCGNQLPITIRKLWLDDLAKAQLYEKDANRLFLKKAMHLAFQNEYRILNSFFSNSGIYIDYLIVRKSDLTSLRNLQNESLAGGQICNFSEEFSNCLRIAVIQHTSKHYNSENVRLSKDSALASLVLQHEGYEVIEICLNDWKKLFEKEQVDYLIRTVNDL